MQDDEFEALCQGWIAEVDQLVDLFHNMTTGQGTKLVPMLKEKHEASEEEIQQLASRGTDVASSLSSTTAGNATLQEELEALQEELQKLTKTLEELQSTYQRDQAAADQLLPKHQHLESAVQVEEATSQRKLGSLESAVQQFRDSLGLRFVSRQDRHAGARELRLEFSCLDPAQLEAVSVLGINILPESQFEVIRCEPHIAALPELLAELNAGGDFGQFVCAVRARFLQLACAGR